MGKKGKKPWQQKEFDEHHAKLKEILKQKGKATIAQLKKESGHGRRIVAKHLKKFIEEEIVVVEPHSWPHLYYWLPRVELQIQYAKYKLLWEIKGMSPFQKVEFLKLQKKSGDPVAARKLKVLLDDLEE